MAQNRDTTHAPDRRTTGMILGKFMPPHLGHQHLIDFARHYVDDLTVLVCSIAREPIPGKLRYQWVKSMYPMEDIRHVTDEVPQEPSDHPDFWQIWHDLIRKHIPVGPDYVFASEAYGQKLAQILGAKYIPLDPSRSMVAVSATMIRKQPLENWRYLPQAVRPYYARRVCVFGPESTGKTTLTYDLARHYKTVAVTEHARPLLDLKDGHCDPQDIDLIARGQMADEDALALQANRVMFCDTDMLTTTIWSDVLFRSCPQWITREASRRDYDLYLLLDIDVPWVNDNQRFLSDQRQAFFDRCKQTLEEHGRKFVIIRGNWQERFGVACEAVNKLLAQAGDSARARYIAESNLSFSMSLEPEAI